MSETVHTGTCPRCSYLEQEERRLRAAVLALEQRIAELTPPNTVVQLPPPRRAAA
jgi:hypothetical protein